MAHDDCDISPIKACEAALDKLMANPDDAEAFQDMAALVAPSLFKGQSKFFDHVCEHAARARGGELLPALNAFMDRLTRQGELPAQEGMPAMEWRTVAILAELHPEDGQDDPVHLSGLEPLRAALAAVAGTSAPFASLSPVALDLRQAEPGFDLFRFCMLPTQAEAIGEDALREGHAAGRLPEGWPEPPRLWKALCASFAFERGHAPAQLLEALNASIGAGVEFQCGYEAAGTQKSAVLVLKMATDPFSCASMALEPERRELQSDLSALALALGDGIKELDAILEPSSQPAEPGQEDPFDAFCLSICAPDGALLDAIWLPPATESVALAHAMLREKGIEPILAPPRRAQFNANGERLWASTTGVKPFDGQAWRERVLSKMPRHH